jgi:hypothetical protein
MRRGLGRFNEIGYLFRVNASAWSGWVLGAVMAVSTVGCQNYSQALQRGQGYYERNQYEIALAVFRHLEPDQNSLTADEVVRYCYLRGMTDFRLGYREDARYWLGLSKASQSRTPSALQDDEKARLDASLAELNIDVFGAPKVEEKPPGSCDSSSQCQGTEVCQNGMCTGTPTP